MELKNRLQTLRTFVGLPKVSVYACRDGDTLYRIMTSESMLLHKRIQKASAVYIYIHIIYIYTLYIYTHNIYICIIYIEIILHI